MADLNPDQLEAVRAPDGPSLVLAGAGSGKTRVITERVLWLIQERDVPPYRILALTFTNRAAGEMKARIAQGLHQERPDVWVGTFHSFGLYILRREMAKLGRSSPFTVADDADQLSLLKRLVRELPQSSAKVSPREALSWISRHKQEDEAIPPLKDGPSPEEETYAKLSDQYHAALTRSNVVDFDDLLVLPAQLLKSNDEVRAKYRERFRHVLVDEYQDTNRAQYAIASELAGKAGNVFAVGDEDQNIYSWRGADIRNILDFESHFDGARVFRLEQNYRSTSPILAAANAVVAHNKMRLGKELWTKKEGGEAVAFYQARDGEDEAQYVAETILKKNMQPKEAAVLCRTNGQIRLFEDAFRRKGIAYTVVGGTRFYARKEIKDLVAYMRLIVNPRDDEAFRRIVNVPPRRVGTATLQILEKQAAARDVPLLEAFRNAVEREELKGGAQREAARLVTTIDDLALEAESASAKTLLEDLLEKTGYREFVTKSDAQDFKTRLEMIDEFLNVCASFDKGDGGGAIEALLQDLSLLTDQETQGEDIPAVTVMTCHSAKGLEFDHVFLVGLEEGLLPHGNRSETPEALEEERRLCYVAMTRARKTLTLSAAESRLIYGTRRPMEPSRFLAEIPRERLAFVASDDPGRHAVVKAPGGAVDTSKLKTGTRIRHARFGPGRIMYTAGSGEKMKVRIRFDKGFSRQFMVRAAPLEIMEGKR